MILPHLFSDEAILEGIARGEIRAVSRLITLCENRVPRGQRLLSKLFSRTGKAHVVGVTGAPGAGKSTLVDQLAVQLRAHGKRTAVLAIDPTSPFSGGAVLGDRIRMTRTLEDHSVYIRSMASRGALGGVSRATIDAVHILDAAGFDCILVETVGVGQGEIDIVKIAHTCLVVLVPGMGDGVQAIKAGILEIADIFVVNKADRDGADQLHRELRVLLSLGEGAATWWDPPIVQTVALDGRGVDELMQQSMRHFQALVTSAHGRQRALSVFKEMILSLVKEQMAKSLTSDKSTELSSLAQSCVDRALDPYSAAERLLASTAPFSAASKLPTL